MFLTSWEREVKINYKNKSTFILLLNKNSYLCVQLNHFIYGNFIRPRQYS